MPQRHTDVNIDLHVRRILAGMREREEKLRTTRNSNSKQTNMIAENKITN